ncbi:MAG: hypothetical protein WAV26_00365 [Candidatus Deferrimicrobium sp.]
MKRQFGTVAAEERGHLFEGWIASVLRAHRDYGNLFDGIEILPVPAFPREVESGTIFP